MLSVGLFLRDRLRRHNYNEWPSDRTRELGPDQPKRCTSDNEWTFGDGFQTLTRPSKRGSSDFSGV